MTTESTTVSQETTRDSSVTVTAYTILRRYGEQLAGIEGTIDQLSSGVNPGGGTESLPFSFSGSFHDGGLVIDSIRGQQIPGVLTCESPALNRLTAIRRNVFVLPPALSRNQAWTDSSTVSACAGGIPVQLTALRTYTVAGESEGKLVIDRQDKTMASGEGSQGQHRITLAARGTGTARLLLDRLTGELLSVSGSSQTEIDIGSSGRRQRFIQVMRERTGRI